MTMADMADRIVFAFENRDDKYGWHNAIDFLYEVAKFVDESSEDIGCLEFTFTDGSVLHVDIPEGWWD